VFEQIDKGGPRASKQGGTFETGVSVLPPLRRKRATATARRRSRSPGNKFEFRAVGSSANIAGANTVLNTIVAESLDFIATKLEADVKAGKDLNKAIGELLPGIIKESKKVVFNGNNYAEEWHNEAAKRGLPNLKNTVEVLPVITRKDTIDLFSKYKVYSPKELESRFNILAEAYVKTLDIEAKTVVVMAKTMILPAALKYQKEVGESIAAAKAAGAGTPAGVEMFGTLISAINDLNLSINKLEKAQAHHARRRLRPREAHAERRVPRAERGPHAPRTSSRPSSPTTSGRCRRTARCCSSSSQRTRHLTPDCSNPKPRLLAAGAFLFAQFGEPANMARAMRLLLFSDLHCDSAATHSIVERSIDCDVLIGAGDFGTMRRGLRPVIDILRRATVPAMLVPGNSESVEELRDACHDWTGAHVLHGSMATIGSITFFGIGGGIPITPFGSWSYDFSEPQAQMLLQACPERCVLVSHSPPKGCVDLASNGQSLGSAAIRQCIESRNPVLVVCGHVHASAGQSGMIGKTPVVNAGPKGVAWTMTT
jgi:Icc-related predicted phosphoesterase